MSPGAARGAADVDDTWDRNDAQLVTGANGMLAAANSAGLLAAADVHITRSLVRLGGQNLDEAAQLAAALAVRSVRTGSTCLTMDDVDELVGAVIGTDGPALPSAAQMLVAVASSRLVGGATGGALDPLVLVNSDDGPLLYLQKYFRQEQAIRAALDARAASGPTVDIDLVRRAIDDVFTDDPAGERQRLAALVTATRWTSVLAGGPGTGKTFTVARILAVLDRLAGGDLRIAMCAPTGRAAAALQASVEADSVVPSAVRAVTVHSLLGWRPGSTPRKGRADKLPHDVVVVDETSMLSMTAMSRLLDAIRPDARLVLVGDPHQLSSVDAGAVLADLVERTSAPDTESVPVPVDPSVDLSAQDRTRLSAGVVTLRHGFRFGSEIAQVADAVNAGDADAAVDLVVSGSLTDVELISPDDLQGVGADITAWARAMHEHAAAGRVGDALDALDSHRVLCAHREGAAGVQGWTVRILDWIADRVGYPGVVGDGEWPVGQPVLVTANDRQTGTFNGDSGIVVATDDPNTVADGVGNSHTRSESTPSSVAFRRGTTPQLVAPTRLADVAPVYAMTIHRSQGSQFDSVTVVLPPIGSELLTRELLYTAITRARRRVRLVGTPDALRAAVSRRVHRASGLRSSVWPMDPPPGSDG